MRRIQLLVLAVLLPAAVAATPPSPQPAVTAAPTPTPDPAIVARARSWYHMLQTGKIDRTQLTAQASGMITDDQVAAVAKRIAPLGDPVTFEQRQIEHANGSTVYIYDLAFGNGTRLLYIFALDSQGKITGLVLRPAQSASP